MELINLHDFIENTINNFDSRFIERDVELPHAFKEYVLAHKDGDKYTFLRYTSIVKASSDLSTYCPNQWFYIAAYYCQLYPILKEYKNQILALFPNTSTKELGESIKKCVNNDEYARTFLGSAIGALDNKEYLISFLSDYAWWKGGKGIERGDFFYSPILSSAKLVNQNQAYVATICQYLIENPEALNILQKAFTDIDSNNIFATGKRLNTTFHDCLFRPYITAIKSKPFLLLAGISGTGKSRIVRELARACWDEESDEYKSHKPRNFEMVQVKPNWHDSSELIGYVSRIDGERYVVGPFLKFMVKAINDPDHPYFLCLDEMNLAPVEQYFAEYLSVIESRKVNADGVVVTDPIIDYEPTDAYKSLIDQLFADNDTKRKEFLTSENGRRLTIPQNLIIVGTVNMDETTFSFSRKVLDRAMTIEMNEVNLKGGLTERHERIGKLGTAELVGTCVEGVDVYSTHKDVCDKVITYLIEVNKILECTPFKIAYRTRNEFLLYVVNNLPYNKDEDGNDLEENYVIARALDEITNMKILSRIEGDETKVSEKFLKGLSDTIKEQLEVVCTDLFTVEETKKKYNSLSLAKLDEMTKKLASGYTSFWS